MVILFVTPYLREKGEAPKGGGFEAYLFRVTGALREFGHTPIILSLGRRDTHYFEDGIEVFFIRYSHAHIGKNKNINLLYDRFCQSRAINRKVKELLQERNIDIIQFPSLFGLSFCYYGNVPAVLRLSSYAKLYYKGYSFSKTELYIWSLCERLGAWRCNAVFGPSRNIADAFAKDIHRAVSVIESPFWNDCKNYDDCIYRERLSEKKYLLFIGRLHIEKGVLTIAEVIQCFLKANPEYQFVLCGEDGMIDGRSSVQILMEAAGECRERITYIQTLPHEMLYPIIEHADFVIFPSLADNFSNACIEAMYFQRVVIGTDGTSYEQLIDDEKSGLLCMPGDAESC